MLRPIYVVDENEANSTFPSSVIRGRITVQFDVVRKALF